VRIAPCTIKHNHILVHYFNTRSLWGLHHAQLYTTIYLYITPIQDHCEDCTMHN